MSRRSAQLSAARDDIRAKGLRATPARVATLVMLREASSPITHAEVAARLREDGVDKATAFRNLNDMTSAGLVRRTELGDHVYRFEQVSPGELPTESHPHFLCTVCGVVSCMEDVELTIGSLREATRVGEVFDILLRGRCNECKRKADG
ncbi:MAG: transcriptional repressor [Planctomycetota bacterium]